MADKGPANGGPDIERTPKPSLTCDAFFVVVGILMTPSPMDYKHFKQLLLSRRAALRDDAEAAGDAGATVELDQTRQGRLSRMDAMQQQAMATETSRRREQELRRIQAALARIDADDYGFCSRCGEEIAAGRLEIDPAATRCILCAD